VIESLRALVVTGLLNIPANRATAVK